MKRILVTLLLASIAAGCSTPAKAHGEGWVVGGILGGAVIGSIIAQPRYYQPYYQPQYYQPQYYQPQYEGQFEQRFDPYCNCYRNQIVYRYR